MRTTELEGKYTRLRAELAEAYAAPVWHTRHIDRLATELAQIDLELQGQHRFSATRPVQEGVATRPALASRPTRTSARLDAD